MCENLKMCENDIGIYPVVIDFDEASRLWKQNKVNIEKRKDAFEYRCGIIKHNGKPCRNKPSHWGKMDHEYKTVPFDYYTWGPCSYHIRRYYMDKNKNIHTLT